MSVSKSRILEVKFEIALEDDFDDIADAMEVITTTIDENFKIVDDIDITDTEMHLHEIVHSVERVDSGTRYRVRKLRSRVPFTGDEPWQQARDQLATIEAACGVDVS